MHKNESSHGHVIPVRFPRERELNLNKDWKWEHKNMGAVDDLVIVVQQILRCTPGCANVAGHLVEFSLDVVSA